MHYSPSMAPNLRTDAELVGETLSGNRDAFAEIVIRYQTLVCSLAYSATGDLNRSEDLAQETFVAVWQELAKLREPEKLRAWVCGIARHRIQDSLRSHHREPTFKAETLDRAGEAPALDAQPSDQAVRKDEVTIMWRALEQIPEIYREPLILFHRENQSVQKVATALDLTEDTVKQRLVRGRKLLQTEVEKVVEGALRRTAPGSVFTSSVLAAVPIGGTAVTKVVIGTAGAAAKAGFIAKILSSPIPFIGSLLIERKRMLAQEEASTSLEERDLLVSHRRMVLRFLVAACVMLTLWARWFKQLDHSVWFAPLLPLTILPLMIAVPLRIVATRRGLARIWIRRGETPVKRSWEFRSSWQPFGLPFVHIRIGFKPQWPAADRAVKAWIAIGHVAQGRLFAFGLVAIAPVSLGGIAIGIVSIGCFAFGAVGLGVLAAGGFAVGIVALGWMASGAIALGLHAAHGFDAYALDFALSPSGPKLCAAYAAHANDTVAREFFAKNEFFLRTSALFHVDRRIAMLLFLATSPLVLWEIVWEIMKGRTEPMPTPPHTPVSDGTA